MTHPERRARSGDLAAGIFVGGASRRMGSPKGLLRSPDGSNRTLIERLLDELRLAVPQAEIHLVGEQAQLSGKLPQAALPDELPDRGPLGGLVSLLAQAERAGARRALVVACDLPFLKASLLRRLAEESPSAKVVCPYLDGRYQPLAARYSVELLAPFRTALHKNELSLQPLVRRCSPELVKLSEDEVAQLRDWDTPEDLSLA